jgi:hypothetical protein
MRVLNERTRVKDAIRNWIASYGLDLSYGADKRGISVGRELLKLDQETATYKDVAELIGNDSWSCKLACSQCGNKTWGIVEIGEAPDYESETAYLCADCLRKALNMLGDN